MTGEPITALPPRPLAVKTFGITDRGRVRPTNEDQFLIAELSKAMRVWQTSLPEPKLQVGEERAYLFLVAAIENFTLNTFRWFFSSDDTGAQKVLAQSPVPIMDALLGDGPGA